jgi:membrane protease YdiL (CAAX protease family)
MSRRSDAVDSRRVGVFLAVAFGLAWVVGAVIYATGGLRDSPELFAGFTQATVLLATGYMFAPAVANVVTRLVTGEGWDGWDDLWLRLGNRRWRYWLAAWLLPFALTLAGMVVYYAAFPGQFDPTLSALSEQLRAAGGTGDLPVGPEAVVAIQFVSALTLGTLINSAFTFGEEFGWRGYLLQTLLPLGERRAALAVGAIWGVWHWPIIAMGHNYGFDYPGAPWTGMLAMVWFTVVVGVILAWVALRARSVWPAVVGHAAVNAFAGFGLLFLAGQPHSLLGPAPTGVVASLPWAAVAAWLLVRDGSFRTPNAATRVGDQQL